jgi:hypothetical protein
MERLREKTIWAIFANLCLPDSHGLDTIDELQAGRTRRTDLGDRRVADAGLSTEALRRRAKDYLLEGHIDTYSFDRAIRNMEERKTSVAEKMTGWICEVNPSWRYLTSSAALLEHQLRIP